MITYRMHFLRTGSTSAKSGKRYVGQLDLPLCAEGDAELRALAGEFEYPFAQLVFSSPLSRCVQTAGILYPGCEPVLLDGLMDMSLGAFEGKSFEELRVTEDFSRWIENSRDNPPPGGEDVEAFTRRLIQTTHGMLLRMMDDKVTSAAVITHGGVIMTLLAAIALPKMPLHEWAVGNGAGFTLLFTPQMWMRDGCAEAYSRLPLPKEAGEDDDDAYYGAE